ncbi:MAG: hypothetical protein ACRDUV_16525 [Pseudonocardiaceae bacterium]
MDHTPLDRQIPGQPSPAADPDQDDRPPGCLTGESDVGPLQWARCPDDARLHLLAPSEVVVAAAGVQAEALCGQALPTEGLTLANGSSGTLCMVCVDGIASGPGLRGHLVSSPAPDSPLISGDAAARALQDYFLANADRGDNAANDELVAELARRIRTLRTPREGGC